MPSCSTRFRRVTRYPQISRANVQHGVDAINLNHIEGSSKRSLARCSVVSMVLFDDNDRGEPFYALASCCVLAIGRGAFEAQALQEVQDALNEVSCCADLEASKRKAPWLPSLCWNRDVFRDAALLVSTLSCLRTKTDQTAMFLPLRRFQLAPLALTRVSGHEALNAWENHCEFTSKYDQATWIGDAEILSGGES